MHAEVKRRLVRVIDSLAARGVAANTVRVNPETAAADGLSATALDFGLESWLPCRDALAAQLTASDHDPVDGKPRPKAPDVAAKIAADACQKSLRRAVVLKVVLDSAVPLGKYEVTGPIVTSEVA